jgi:hypothetical protein
VIVIDDTDVDSDPDPDEKDQGEESDPTPLVNRLRSRTKSGLYAPPSEEGDGGDEAESGSEEEEGRSEASPVTGRKRRSGDEGLNGDVSMKDAKGRELPKRKAKKKALKAIRGENSDGKSGEEDTEDGSEGMEVDINLQEEDEESQLMDEEGTEGDDVIDIVENGMADDGKADGH